MPTITIKHERFQVPVLELTDIRNTLNSLDQPNDESGCVAVVIQRPSIQASAPLATAADVSAQVIDLGTINDSAALTIASWYASPQGTGPTFNDLATGRAVAIDELVDAINAELVRPSDPYYGECLEALARWAEQGVDQD